ncbi:hypothetical protein EDD21DRAFT_393188 [Dissophora ornata]|nr:hypothetical protein EDD21DRAFT_393188 [Dissophora ornata]
MQAIVRGGQLAVSRTATTRPTTSACLIIHKSTIAVNPTPVQSVRSLLQRQQHHTHTRRLYSSGPSPSNSGTSATATATTITTSTTSSSSSTVSEAVKSSAGPKLTKFKQYAEQFKNKPASHLIAFGILHEITAVAPLPVVYFALMETGVKIPFPEQAMEEGNKFVARVAKYYGWNLEGAEGARVMLNMASSYALVKALMPLRLALCVWMTPWTATRIISPVMNVWRRFKK